MIVESEAEYMRKVLYYLRPEHEDERMRIVRAAAQLMQRQPSSQLAEAVVQRIRQSIEA